MRTEAGYGLNVVQQALDSAVLAEAIPCPLCGTVAIEAHVERVTYWGDEVIQWALERYHCASGHDYIRKLEIDRISKDEREAELEKALKRAEFEYEQTRGLLGGLRRRWARAEANRRWPARPEPDLMERYMQAREEAEKR